jgi:CBS domain containing-hemolysin-like protein
MNKMTKMNQDPESPQTELQQPGSESTEQNRPEQTGSGILHVVRTMLMGKPDTTLRETIEEYIEEDKTEAAETPSVSDHEKQLLGNILKLRDLTAFDVMIPRTDIVAISKDTTEEELLDILAKNLHSRLPVYKESLDNVIGSIHVKDIISVLATGKKIDIPALIRDIPVVSPSMKVLDLLLQMRMTGKHMVLVIDEFGGVDGLIAIGDVIEAVVGEIDDEHDPEEEPEVQIRPDGTVIADARLELEDFEERFGIELSAEEKEENDTLGGLIFTMAGQVPVRGEILKHESGLIFEIIEADTRRVKSVSVKNLPKSALLQAAAD